MKKHLLVWILSLLLSVGAFAQVTATGTVISGEDNFPIIGAAVQSKEDPTIGTATDMDGNFTLEVPAGTKTLVISYIGMKTQEVAPKMGLKITLMPETEVIEDVVVTGFQKIDRKMFTGAAQKITAEEAKIDGVADISHSLQGRVAGVSVQSVSGTFGVAPKMRVRASASLFGNTQPLYVVDGVILEDVAEMTADELSSGDASTALSSRIAGISSEDIEDFQVLMDANAVGLYGARARNGVIVITTKRGKKGQAALSYSGEFTYRLRPSYSQYDIMNSQDQMSVYQEMKQKGWLYHVDMASGRTQNGGSYFLMNDMIYKGKLANNPLSIANYERYLEQVNTDWFEELFNLNVQQYHSLSITGGTEKGAYRASLSYRGDPGWTKGNELDVYTASFNSFYEFNKKLKLTLLANAMYRNQIGPGTEERNLNVVTGEYERDFDINPYSYAVSTSRTMSPYDEHGNLQYYRQNFAPFNILNELDNNIMEMEQFDVKFQGELEWKPIKELTLTGLLAYSANNSQTEHKIYDNSNYANAYRAADDATMAAGNKFLYQDPMNPDALPEVVMKDGGFYNTKRNTMNSLYVRATADYDAMIGEDFRIHPMLGADLKRTNRTVNYADGYAFSWSGGGQPILDWRMMQDMLIKGAEYYGYAEGRDRQIGLFATTALSFRDKYTLSLIGRYDGSNRMGRTDNSRWLPTWSVSGKWNIGEESWMQNQNVFSSLALRGSYGLTADLGPMNNAYVIYYYNNTWRPLTDPNRSDEELSLYINQLANDDLTWEKQYELNVGLDMGFLNERINVSTNFYTRRTFDMIAPMQSSGVGGQGMKWGNVGKGKAWGAEATITTQNIVNKDFNWTTHFTYSYSKDEVTELDVVYNAIGMCMPEGVPLVGNAFHGLYSYRFAGLSEEGYPLIYNENGVPTSTAINFQDRNGQDYLKYEGSIDPSVTGGLRNSFRWKNWTADIFFSYQFGNKIRLNSQFASSYSDMQSMSKSFNNRWMVPGDEHKTNVPVIASYRQVQTTSNLDYGYNAYNYSDVRVADGGFIRLKEVALGYNFTQPWVEKIGLSNLNCRLTASNLWLVYSDSKLNGQDPEFIQSGGIAMPTPRQITFKISTNF